MTTKEEKKKGKPKRTPLEKIQTLETMKVAKLFFNTYLTPSIVTKVMHPEAYKKVLEKNQQGFVMPYIRECLKEWKEAEFIETSPVKLPFRVEKKKGESYFLKNYGYRLNLEPLYCYCKEKHNIEFTKEEKVIINKRVGLEVMRKRIFIEYPNDDIINAIIKFYIKQYAIPPHIEILYEQHRKILKDTEKMVDKEQKRAEESMKKIKEKLKEPKPSKKESQIVAFGFERELMKISQKQFCEVMIDKKTQKLKVPLENLKKMVMFQELKLYIASFKKNPKLMLNINAKFKKALGILA